MWTYIILIIAIAAVLFIGYKKGFFTLGIKKEEQKNPDQTQTSSTVTPPAEVKPTEPVQSAPEIPTTPSVTPPPSEPITPAPEVPVAPPETPAAPKTP